MACPPLGQIFIQLCIVIIDSTFVQLFIGQTLHTSYFIFIPPRGAQSEINTYLINTIGIESESSCSKEHCLLKIKSFFVRSSCQALEKLGCCDKQRSY